MNFTSVLAFLLDFLANGLTGLLTTPKLALGTNILSPGLHTVFTDLGTPTITGYTQKAVAWSAPVFDPVSGLAEVLGTAVYDWQGPSDASGQTIQSVGLVDTTGLILLASTNLQAPVQLTVNTNALALSIRVRSDGSVTAQQIFP